MNRPAGALVALLVVLAGCGAPVSDDSPDPATGALNAAPVEPPDSDRLGWEDGYWHNATLSVTTADGLNESERQAVVARAMARVERIRRLEFQQSVPINVTSRSTYRNRTTGGASKTSAKRTFENVKSEALFLVGEQNDSVSKSQQTRSQTVLGYYSTRTNDIVLISESATPTLNSERTLAHELVHALQDQHLHIGSGNVTTEDGRAGMLGLVEGDAMVVQRRYMNRCGQTWQCLNATQKSKGGDSDGGSSGANRPSHMGLYLASIFPYVDGPTFVESLREDGGWKAVNAAYEDFPASAEQIIHPSRYGSDRPVSVTFEDRTANGWTRIRANDSLSDRLGQSLLSTTFLYTLYDDYNRNAVVSPRAALNFDDDGSVNSTDPLNYGLDYTDGWEGDRIHAYEKGNATGYVWKLRWEDGGEATEFASGYRGILEHWGGRQVGPNRWVVEGSEFADAFAVVVEGDTVTIVNAPTTEQLGDVYRPVRRERS